MTGIRKGHLFRGGVCNHKEGSCRNRLFDAFQEAAQTQVESSKKTARIVYRRSEFFEQGAQDLGDYRPAQALPRDVADEDAGASLRKRKDIKEITADCLGQAVTMCE